MQILSLRDGGVLYEGPYQTIKRTLEQAVKDNINLSYADLRGADLRGAALDGAQLSGSCFWGADLSGADMSDAYLHKADLRLAKLNDTCLANSVATSCDFRGAYFHDTIMSSVDLSSSQFSCPSFLNQDFLNIRSLKGCVYHHYGEMECRFDQSPVKISGLKDTIIMIGNHVLIGAQCHDRHNYDGIYRSVINSISDLGPRDKSSVNVLLRN
ncbi:MAG: pentapeptide repeat-containing protein [Pseudomonadota bacterium]